MASPTFGIRRLPLETTAHTGFTHMTRIYAADIVAADAGAGTAGTITLASVAVGDIVGAAAVNLTTSLVVSDSGATLTASIGVTSAATQVTAAVSVLGTATPVLNFGTTNQGIKCQPAAVSLLLTLTPASAKNLSAVTAGQMDIYFTLFSSTALSVPTNP